MAHIAPDQGANVWTKTFWQAVAERALKAFASTAGALVVANPVSGAFGGNNIFHADLATIAQVSATAALVSVLLNVGSGALTNSPGPSLTRAEQVVQTPQV